jgi:cytochrome c oxidase subunit 1
MHTLGVYGHMRRIYDPTRYDFLKPIQPINEFISYSAFALFSVQIIFALNFILSWWTGKEAGRNPWNDTGLEWDTTSPAPHGNFDHPPTVYHGPYEFSHPETAEDYLMQNRKLPSSSQPASRPAGH